ncbi:thioredoxin family protein [Nocardia sp. alder85J]|uniref:thioredoxin family protein n=1 Tax=Nocardia sp. alder85J TaxID=2862949 RepID=UPI001CD5776B|nr:thioredoxin family protein [Nocardia sp. alder85J]MCX4093356.1 thioredoxin family protein [Nocardia sp. alder85J]
MTALIILVVVLLAGLAAGLILRNREGRARETPGRNLTADDAGVRAGLLAAAGVTVEAPVILHFSAEWCGPCAAVRRVVAGVATELADSPQPPRDIEIDIDDQPALARELNVLSLPTTFVFDADGRERFRISGVPRAADLHSAVRPLTVPQVA